MFPAEMLQKDPQAWQRLTLVTRSPVCGRATVCGLKPSQPRLRAACQGLACQIWGRRCRGGKEPVSLSITSG